MLGRRLLLHRGQFFLGVRRALRVHSLGLEQFRVDLLRVLAEDRVQRQAQHLHQRVLLDRLLHHGDGSAGVDLEVALLVLGHVRVQQQPLVEVVHQRLGDVVVQAVGLLAQQRVRVVVLQFGLAEGLRVLRAGLSLADQRDVALFLGQLERVVDDLQQFPAAVGDFDGGHDLAHVVRRAIHRQAPELVGRDVPISVQRDDLVLVKEDLHAGRDPRVVHPGPGAGVDHALRHADLLAHTHAGPVTSPARPREHPVREVAALGQRVHGGADDRIVDQRHDAEALDHLVR